MLRYAGSFIKYSDFRRGFLTLALKPSTELLNFNSRRNRECYQQIVTFKTCFGFTKIVYKNVEVRNTALNESFTLKLFFLLKSTLMAHGSTGARCKRKISCRPRNKQTCRRIAHRYSSHFSNSRCETLRN
jgi:hypothetical protein